MTDLAPPRNYLLPQLSGVAVTQHEPPRKISFAREIQGYRNDRFVIISNTKSSRFPNVCVCVNGSEGQGFAHKGSVSQICRQQSFADNENKNLKYLSLLKEYTSAVLSVKTLISELENLLEEQSSDDENKSSCSKDSSWDLSKALNVLERYKAETKIIKNLEIRFRSFLKSEMPYLCHMIGVTLKSLFKFVQSAQNDILLNVHMILSRELTRIHSFSVASLMRTESGWRATCKHLCQLAGKFEKLASDSLSESSQWACGWRSRVLVFVSKRGGIRTKAPLLYLKILSEPYLTLHLKVLLSSMTMCEFIGRIIQERTFRVSEDAVSIFYSLIFDEERYWKLHEKFNGLHEAQSSPNGSAEDQQSKEKIAYLRKNLAAMIKRARNKFIQELWVAGHQEEPLVSECLVDVVTPDNKFSRSFDSQLITNESNNILHSNHSEKKSNTKLNGISSNLSTISKISTSSKKVHWGDMVDSSYNKKLLDGHMDTLWNTLSDGFANALCFCAAQVDVPKQQWDMSLTAMDLDRASVAQSCLTFKRLRADSGDVNPTFQQCVKDVSAKVSCTLAMQRWDQAMRNAQATSLKDKCRTDPNSPNKHSDTMGLIIEAITPVQSILESQTSSRGPEIQSLVSESGYDKTRTIVIALLALYATLRTSIDWMQNKSQQFVSSGSWEQYLVITHKDAMILQEKLRTIVSHFVTLTRTIHCMEKPDVLLIQTLDNIQIMFSEVKSINSKKTDVLAASIKARATTTIQQHFPPSKQWRKRGATRIPLDPNSYVKIAAHQVLAPVIESVKSIDAEEADVILRRCFAVFISSLMEHILRESIRFSFYGAHQLRLDFTCLKDWIGQESLQLPSDTISNILAVHAFSDFDSAITLLCCQPESRRRPTNAINDVDTGSSMGSSSSQGSFNGSFYESTIRDIELRTKEQWLALRVKGGQSKNRLLCITPS